jgi:hypothetical protein
MSEQDNGSIKLNVKTIAPNPDNKYELTAQNWHAQKEAILINMMKAIKINGRALTPAEISMIRSTDSVISNELTDGKLEYTIDLRKAGLLQNYTVP